MKYAIAVIAIIATLTVSGCTKDAGDSGVSGDVELWQGELPIRDPWLRDRMPDDVLLYLRIPNLFGLLATPKGNVMDTALRSRTNVENVQKIRAGLIDNVLTLLPANASQLTLFERHAGTFLPAPSALVAVTLDMDSNADFEDLVGELGFSLDAPLDAQGTGQLIGFGSPTFVRFQADSGQLLLHAGPGANEQRFAELLAALERDTPHPMRAMENRVDASGQGMFLWMNAQEALPAMQMFVPMDQYQQMIDAGLDKTDSVAVGWGVANGKSRLAMVADVSRDREMLPVIANPLSARSVGHPDALFLMSFPGVDYFEQLKGTPFWTDESTADWEETNEALRELSGVTFEEFLAALGPEIMLILDRAGDYAAVRLRDADLWDELVERIASTTGSSPDTFERGARPTSIGAHPASLLSWKSWRPERWAG